MRSRGFLPARRAPLLCEKTGEKLPVRSPRFGDPAFEFRFERVDPVQRHVEHHADLLRREPGDDQRCEIVVARRPPRQLAAQARDRPVVVEVCHADDVREHRRAQCQLLHLPRQPFPFAIGVVGCGDVAQQGEPPLERSLDGGLALVRGIEPRGEAVVRFPVGFQQREVFAQLRVPVPEFAR